MASSEMTGAEETDSDLKAGHPYGHVSPEIGENGCALSPSVMDASEIYRAFGLQWRARQLRIPELPLVRGGEASDRMPLIAIEPEDPDGWPKLPPSRHDTVILKTIPGDLRLQFAGIGRFRIRDGHHIAWWREHAEVSDGVLRTYLLGPAIGALLIQRGALLLHGNALEREGRAIICLGHSGDGKSTLAYMLMQQGWRLLADDLAVITPDGLVQPGIPRIRLRHDTIRAFGLNPQSLPAILKDADKFHVTGHHLQSASEAVPLQALYLIQPHRHQSDSSEQARIRRINSQQMAFWGMRHHTPWPRFIRGQGQEGAYFLAVARLLHQVPLATLPVPEGIMAMQDWVATQDLLQAAEFAEAIPD